MSLSAVTNDDLLVEVDSKEELKKSDTLPADTTSEKDVSSDKRKLKENREKNAQASPKRDHQRV